MATSFFFGSRKPFFPFYANATAKTSPMVGPKSNVKSYLPLYATRYVTIKTPPRHASLRVRANLKGQILKEINLKTHNQAEAGDAIEIKCKKPWRCHPEVDLIREEAHAWLRKYVYIPQLEAADIPLLQLSMVPCGSIQGATILAKFLLFLCPFDDLMDQLQESSPESLSLQKILAYMLAILNGNASALTPPQGFPLLLAFPDLCADIQTHATPLQWKRFVEGMATYLQGLTEQPQLKISPYSTPPDLSTYICIRRKVLGGAPSQPLVQLALGVDVEETLWKDALQKLHCLIDDYLAFTNDIVSVNEDDGVIWNVVSILQASTGCTMKEAILLTCQKVEYIETEFDSLLQKIKVSPLVQSQAPLLEYLDAISSSFPAYIMFSGRNKRHATRHTTINTEDGLVLKLSYDC